MKMSTTIKQRLEDYMKESGISQARIAPLMGVSMTALSQYRNGKYRGDSNAVESKIEEYLKTVEAQKEYKEKIHDYRCVQND